MFKNIFYMCLVALCVSCSNNKTSAENSSLQSNAATGAGSVKTNALPSFDVKDVNGNKIDIASLKGKKIFINFWATWCPPCREELPSIEALYKKADQQASVFLFISLDDDFNAAKTYIKDNSLSIPIYSPASKLPDMFNTGGIPATFIFDKNGNLIKENDGADDYNTKEYQNMFKS